MGRAGIILDSSWLLDKWAQTERVYYQMRIVLHVVALLLSYFSYWSSHTISCASCVVIKSCLASALFEQFCCIAWHHSVNNYFPACVQMQLIVRGYSISPSICRHEHSRNWMLMNWMTHIFLRLSRGRIAWICLCSWIFSKQNTLMQSRKSGWIISM